MRCTIFAAASLVLAAGCITAERLEDCKYREDAWVPDVWDYLGQGDHAAAQENYESAICTLLR